MATSCHRACDRWPSHIACGPLVGHLVQVNSLSTRGSAPSNVNIERLGLASQGHDTELDGEARKAGLERVKSSLRDV